MASSFDVASVIPFEPLNSKYSRAKVWRDAGFKVAICDTCEGFGVIPDFDVFSPDDSYFDTICDTCEGTGRVLTKKIHCNVKLNTQFINYERSTKSEANTPG